MNTTGGKSKPSFSHPVLHKQKAKQLTKSLQGLNPDNFWKK